MYLCIQTDCDRQDPLQSSFSILAHLTDLEVDLFFLSVFSYKPDLKRMSLDRVLLARCSPLMRIERQISGEYRHCFVVQCLNQSFKGISKTCYSRV